MVLLLYCLCRYNALPIFCYQSCVNAVFFFFFSSTKVVGITASLNPCYYYYLLYSARARCGSRLPSTLLLFSYEYQSHVILEIRFVFFSFHTMSCGYKNNSCYNIYTPEYTVPIGFLSLPRRRPVK